MEFWAVFSLTAILEYIIATGAYGKPVKLSDSDKYFADLRKIRYRYRLPRPNSHLSPIDDLRTIFAQPPQKTAFISQLNSYRPRREIGAADLSFKLQENYPLGPLPKRIRLGSNERIKDWNLIENPYIQVHRNGTLELKNDLNYELDPQVSLTVILENTLNPSADSAVRIVIDVEDVPEKPNFISGPLPYQAVVPVESPIGFSIYKFNARDEAGDGDEDVEYILLNPAEMFEIDSNGWVKTKQSRYELGKTYYAYVRARDKTPDDTNIQESDVAVLDIRGGPRPPQFYEQQYRVEVPEDTPPTATIVHISAKPFPLPGYAQEPIRFSLRVDTASSDPSSTITSDTFEINPEMGTVKLMKRLDYDDPLKPRVYKLIVEAKEGLQKNEVPLEVIVTDVNDNAPVFTQPLYTKTIKEDYPLGQEILRVSVRDKDSGRNAEVQYNVDNRNFTIDDEGRISAVVKLDADQHRQGFFIYRFSITAKDLGENAHTATAKVELRTENVNDERPRFLNSTGLYLGWVAEDAQGNTPILAVQAQDPDRDQVSYSFLTARGTHSAVEGLFQIDKDTGMIKLRPNVRSEQLKDDMYNMTVIALDDGSCCPDGPTDVQHSSTAQITISVADVNDNKPTFPDCDSYSKKAKIKEGKHLNDTLIITVTAIDEDSNENGQVIYSLYYPKGESRKPFTIDFHTGELRASRYITFDREEKAYEDVTVKATDKGKRPLIGFCRFTVEVEDDNDNAPQFDRGSYETSISRATPTGQSVINVFADDRDSPQNAAITYSLKPDESAGRDYMRDKEYFNIRSESGEIMLVNGDFGTKSKFKFLAVATDSGTPKQSTEVSVVINVRSATQSAPKWKPTDGCPDLVKKKENVPLNTIFFKCYAETESNPNNPISYTLANGVKSGTNAGLDFHAFQEKRQVGLGVKRDWVVIRNLKGLDYEKTAEYTLTITATDLNTGVASDRTVRVVLDDVNDEVPKFTLDKFTGSVLEEQTPSASGKPVATVQAIDSDNADSDFSKIRYRLLDGPNFHLFRIDDITGNIFALQKFDREQNDAFILDVEARDGAKSDLPDSEGPNRDITKVRILVQDVNDNAPTFNQTLYKGKISETASEGQNVITVKADDKDIDSHLKYELLTDSRNHQKLDFGVNPNSGTIYVANRLDYETQIEYRLKLRVSDGQFTAETDVEIMILDENDNAPEFDQKQYEYTIEENNDYPKQILQVRATDKDAGPQSDRIVYRLIGQGTPDFFEVDDNGWISVVGRLDRDPGTGGAPEYNFIVHALDNGGLGDCLTGYADVKVRITDVNDNGPVFEEKLMTGFVDENRDPGIQGVYVTTVVAKDYDDPTTDNAKVRYDMLFNKEINGTEVFSVEPHSGKIFAKVKLDRENPAERQFEIEIRAVDHGVPPRSGTGKVLIKVRDVNDNAPTFSEHHYFASVKETARVGDPVFTVSAQDRDDEASENVLQYELIDRGSKGYQYFYMKTDPDTSGSNVGILRVKKPLDYEDPSQRDFQVEIQVYDGKFTARTKATIKLEDANDNPPTISGPERIEIKEDVPRWEVIGQYDAVDPDFGGKDTHIFSIDRQTDPYRQFSINQKGVLRVAKPLDRERIASYDLKIMAVDPEDNTGSTTVKVFLKDVNDNAPILVPNPDPCIVWENKPANQPACQVKFKDLDGPDNGPPFVWKVENTKEFRFDDGYDYFNVTGLVEFDREGPGGKFRKIPVTVSDSGQPQQTEIRYLEIVIGDKNDNPMSSGSKTIHVYSYKGQLPKSEIGRAYVKDADDWDLPDKDFSWKGSQPDNFDLNQESGMITMNAGVKEGKYPLEITVIDRKRGETATANVEVLVTVIPQEAFDNSATIRIGAITGKAVHPHDFIALDAKSDSPYSRFQQKLADLLNVPKDYVQIFSVMPAMSSHNVAQVDIRFAVHGSGYKSGLLLHGTIQQSRKEFVDALAMPDVTIVQVSIDACLNASCDDCWNAQYANATPALVNANKTSLVGVTTWIEGKCGCPPAFVPFKCQKGACMNGGVCYDTYPGFFCDCSHTGHKGMQCQARGRSFQGAGYAWFKPIVACTSANISFEFMTKSPNALFLYNGPMTAPGRGYEEGSMHDFLTIRLANGKPQATIELGNSGAVPAVIGVDTRLDDGKWHRIDFNFHLRDIELVIDRCQDAKDAIDFPRCRQTAITAQFMEDERLNVMDPLQIGGVSPSTGYSYDNLGANVAPLDGCIRNLVINEELYNLADAAKEKGTVIGCQHTAGKCEINQLDGPVYCIHGECIASIAEDGRKCICDPGWHGERCDKNVTWYQFNSQSFIQYFLNVPTKPNYADSKVLFITKQGTGTLFQASNKQQSHLMRTYLQNRRPLAIYDRGRGQEMLDLSDIGLAGNQSYWLEMELSATSARLSLDGLPGQLTVESRIKGVESDGKLDFDSRSYYIGAESEQARDDFRGCIGDFRLNDYWMPLTQAQEQSYGGVRSSKGVTAGCPLITTCAMLGNSYCPLEQICVNFWKGPFCTCPTKFSPVLDDAGRLLGCGESLAVTQLGITNGAVIAIILCLLALIIVVLALVVYTRRRRPIFEEVAPEYEGGTIINYDYEGGLDNDNTTYNIDALKKPVLPPENGGLQTQPPPRNGDVKRPPPSDIGGVINGRVNDADNDPAAPPFDELRVYEDEGEGLSPAGSLSSLSSGGESDVDWDEQLNNWGPRFQRLADMYGGQEE